MTGTAIVWLREDLRLHDNPALDHALRRYDRVIPLYLHTPAEAGEWAPGGASRWWLHHSLRSLDAALRAIGGRLVIDAGPSALDLLRQYIARTGACAVLWNRLYTPWALARDAGIARALAAADIEAVAFNAALLFEPAAVLKPNGEPYRVFTAFWKRCTGLTLYQPLSETPARLRCGRTPPGISAGQLGLLPSIAWDGEFPHFWTPGEAAALRRLEDFLDEGVADYGQARELPGIAGTSRLSAHLHFGELSPRLAMNAALQRLDSAGNAQARRSIERFMTELGWREFAAHVLFHYPATSNESMDGRFAYYPWQDDAAALRRWQQGRTGIPIIDAGMRELWRSGWMHNRVRMLVASFLVKNLRQHWLRGARWFWDTLLDADLASNSLGWQWVAGSGTDAAPYFRIFNPVLQGIRFDPHGDYVRRWVPELRRLDGALIHEPWKAGTSGYPPPMVDLRATRAQALEAFRSLPRREHGVT